MKKYGKYLGLLGLAAVVAVSGVSAYFTATDTATNNFDVKEVKVDLAEPSWDNATDTDDDGTPDVAEDVTPNETIAKDPTVTNIGTTDQFVFLKVTVPYANIITAELDGTKIDRDTTVDGIQPGDVELFTWNTTNEKGALNALKGAEKGKVNEGWTLVKTIVGEADADGKGVVEYIYAYGTTDAMTALVAEASTPALFNSVTMCNAIEGQGLENKTATIDVNVYAIQTSDLGKDADTDATVSPLNVLKIYMNQNNLTFVDGTK
jgi:predicted ribosomally synthesized peptide with SipW-like signal peptide